MSSYEYTDEDGDKLEVTPSVQPDRAFLSVSEDAGRHTAVHVLKVDAPTVAAELLKAAGQEAIILPAADMPSYELSDSFLTFQLHNGGKASFSLRGSSAELRLNALCSLVAAEYIESKAQREADAEKKLQERRDALSFELVPDITPGLREPYASRTASLRKAIDRIIELEDGK